MAVRGTISEIYDLTSIEDQHKEVLKKIEAFVKAIDDASKVQVRLKGSDSAKDITANVKELDKAHQNLNNTFEEYNKQIDIIAKSAALATTANYDQVTSLRDLTQQIASNQIAQKELARSKKDLDKAYESGTITLDDYNKELADIIKRQTELKVSGSQLQQTLRNIEKEAQAAEGSLNELRAQLNIALQAFDALSAADKGSDVGKELEARIQSLTKTISEQEQATGRFQRNVGNYQGSARIIVDALSDVESKIEELKVKQQGLVDLTKRNPLGIITTKQREELNQVTDQIGFLTEKAKALQAVTDNPQFLNIAGKVVDVNKEIRFFTQRLIELEQAGLKDDKVFKDVQKRLAELTDQVQDTRQEIKALSSDTRTFDQFAGAITFAADTFQTAAGAAALFGKSEEDVARITKNLVAIQSVANGVKGIANELTTKGTAANKAYNFVLQQGTILFGRGSTAAQRFGAALKFTGIGLAITGISLLAEKMGLFGDNTTEASEAVDKLTTSFEAQQQFIDQQTAAIDLSTKLQVERLKQIGATQDDITEEEIKALREKLEIENREYLAAAGKRIELEDKVAKYVELKSKTINKFRKISIDGESIESINKQAEEARKNEEKRRQESLKAGNELNLALARQQTKLAEDQRNQQKENDDKLKEQRKKSAEEQKRILEANLRAELELLKLRNQLIIDDNTALADSEVLFAKTRLDALAKIAEAEKNIITAQSDFELKKAGLTVGRIIEIRQKLSNAVTFDERVDILKSFGLSPEQVVLFEKAAEDLIKVQQNLLTKSTNIQLQQSRSLLDERNRLLAEEKELLEKRAEDEAAANQKQVDDLKADLDERLQLIQAGADNALAANNERFEKQLISQKEYEEEKKRVEALAIKESLLAQIDYYNKLLEIQKASGVDVTDTLAQLAKLRKEISQINVDQATDKIRSNTEAIEDFLSKASDYFTQVTDIINGFFEASATRQKNLIQDEIDLIDERTEKEIQSIEQTATTKEDAANRVAIVEARAAAQKRVLEQRQREIDQRKAQFDKANTIAQIIISTALGVVKALPNIPLAVATGAIGAAQLAVAIATPIPRFKEGKNLDQIQSRDKYEGPAYVGDGNKSELIERADGRMEVTPARPTLTWIGKDDIVHPDADLALQTTLRSTEKVMNSNVTVTPVIDFSPVTNTLKKEFKQLNTTIKNKTENHFHSPSAVKLLMQKNGDGWTKHL